MCMGGPGMWSKNIICLYENVPKKASAGAEEKGQYNACHTDMKTSTHSKSQAITVFITPAPGKRRRAAPGTVDSQSRLAS